MTVSRGQSTRGVILSDPELAAALVRLDNVTQFTGLRPRQATGDLDWALVLTVGNALGKRPMTSTVVEAKRAAAADHDTARHEILSARDLVEQLQAEVEASPRPQTEWAPVLDTLGEELVAGLVGTSPSSIRRYAAGGRTTPQDVAERLHFLALVLGQLAGSYNDYGMRRWFSRPRTALDGRAPADLMGKNFDPDGPAGERIRTLAESLRAA